MGKGSRTNRARKRGKKGSKTPANNPIWLGLTGSLASGKSTALEAFRKAGCRVLSSDGIVAQIYRERGLTKEMLRKKYGGNSKKLKALEKWVHPEVKKRVMSALQRTSKKFSVVEVPLLFETSFHRLFDKNIFIFASKKDRKRRAVKRGMKATLFEFLESQQLAPLQKASLSDFVLHNVGSASELQKQVKALLHWLKIKNSPRKSGRV